LKGLAKGSSPSNGQAPAKPAKPAPGSIVWEFVPDQPNEAMAEIQRSEASQASQKTKPAKPAKPSNSQAPAKHQPRQPQGSLFGKSVAPDQPDESSHKSWKAIHNS